MDLTAPETAGRYCYGACVVAVTDEPDTTNNCSGSVEVTVSEPEQSAPGVEVSAEDDKEWTPVGDTVDLTTPAVEALASPARHGRPADSRRCSRACGRWSRSAKSTA